MCKNNKTNRCYGIDLLKTAAMFMVVILHVLNRGGILGTASADSVQCWAAWFIDIAAYCAAHCFAISTGYLMVDRDFKYRKILHLWAVVFFYSVVIMKIGAVAFPKSAAIKNMVKCFFPVTSGEYWYFTSYFCMYFFIPFFNILMDHLTKKQYLVLITTGFVLFSVVQVLNIASSDCFSLGDGYSAWFMIYLYFLGAGIKKHHLFQRLTVLSALGGYLAMAGITLASKYLIRLIINGSIPKISMIFYTFYDENRFISYLSPTIIAEAVFLTVFCLKIRIPGCLKKCLKWLSPMIFQVYLIHTHAISWKYLMPDRFSVYASYNPVKMILAILMTAAGIYIFCIICDKIRLSIFNSLHINKSIDRIADRFTAKISHF